MPGPALEGFALGLSLIVAIGAQNAFVLRQGLSRAHVLPIVLLCALSDATLIGLGVAGLGTLIRSSPAVLEIITIAGALFLSWYGALAARRAFRPKTLKADGDVIAMLKPALAMTLAFTFLNPHVYLDTVVLFGGLSARYDDTGRVAFAVGGAVASAVWFLCLGFGARLLAPVFRKPVAWRVLDALIALVMLLLAAGLVIAL